MVRVRKKIASLILVATICSDFVVGGSVNTDAITTANTKEESSAVNEYGLANQTNQGTILHAFSWSFNTIKSKMAQIADCGYSSIQVSPIAECYQNGGHQHTWEWENTYQPIYFKIGNYIVGSEDEFKSMCAEAHKYGIKIIVDVVANNLSRHKDWIEPSIRNNSSLFHNNGAIFQWYNRFQVTQGDILGCPDMNTQNKSYQNLLINYLNRCIDDGADGFRFDAANHIELPDEGFFGGDFWPTILNAIKTKKSDAFVYGEVLQDSMTPYSEYASLMGTTADSYGESIRDAINNKNLTTGLINYCVPSGGSPTNLVTYSETHDTFANKNAASSNMNWWQVTKGYEIVAARASGVPLFLARPTTTGFNSEGKLEGPVGQPTTYWCNAEVKAVNKFHNAMIGENEYFRSINRNILAIERGNKGVVIVNIGDGCCGTIETNLANGVYTDQVTGKTVTVRNGYMTGIDIASGSTAVIYNPEGNVQY